MARRVARPQYSQALKMLAVAQIKLDKAREQEHETVAEADKARTRAAREAHAQGASYAEMGAALGLHRSRARQLVRDARA
jgi:hypothetical protein